MNLVQDTEQQLMLVEPLLIGVLLLRLASQGLARVYTAFAGYLLVWLVQDLVPLMLGFDLSTDTYALFFFVLEPITWLLSYLVVVELFDLTLASFPGIRSGGKLLFTASIVIAIAAALLTALPSAWTKHGSEGLILIYSVVERTVMVVILVILAGLQVVIVRYRLALPKNTIVYSFTYAFYFTARAIQAYLLAALGPNVSGIVNSAGMIVDMACLLVLILLLSRSGNEVQQVPGPRLSNIELKRLQVQMSSINEVAARIRPWGKKAEAVRSDSDKGNLA